MNNTPQKPNIDEVFSALPRESAPEGLAGRVMQSIRTGTLDVTYHPQIIEAVEPLPGAFWPGGKYRRFMELAAAASFLFLGVGLLYNPGAVDRTTNVRIADAGHPAQLNLQEIAMSVTPFESKLAERYPASFVSSTAAQAISTSHLADPLLHDPGANRMNQRERLVRNTLTGQPLNNTAATGAILNSNVRLADQPVYKNISNIVPGANLLQTYRAFVKENVFDQFFAGPPPKLLIVSNFDKLPAIAEDGPFVSVSQGNMLKNDRPQEPYNLILQTVEEVVQKTCAGRVVSWELLTPENKQTSPVLMVTCIAAQPETTKITSVFCPENLVVPDRSSAHKCKREVKVVGADLSAANSLDFNDTFNAQIANVRKVSLEEETQTRTAATAAPPNGGVKQSHTEAAAHPVKFDLYCRMVRLSVDIEQ